MADEQRVGWADDLRRTVHDLNNRVTTVVIRVEMLAEDLSGPAADDVRAIAQMLDEIAQLGARLEQEADQVTASSA